MQIRYLKNILTTRQMYSRSQMQYVQRETQWQKDLKQKEERKQKERNENKI